MRKNPAKHKDKSQQTPFISAVDDDDITMSPLRLRSSSNEHFADDEKSLSPLRRSERIANQKAERDSETQKVKAIGRSSIKLQSNETKASWYTGDTNVNGQASI